VSGWLFQALPDSRDRIFLLKRVNGYLRSRRRGRLRLPQYFPREVRALCELSKTQLADRMFWVKPSTSLSSPLPKWAREFVSATLPGHIWTGTNNLLIHKANGVGTARLRKTDWPGVSRSRWPSTPSFSEMMAMSRLGFSTTGLDKTRIVVNDHITSKQVRDNISLATKLVTNNIVGIRSGVELMTDYRQYFRLRHGFLILSTRHNLPSGLVRKLISRWIRSPTSLWLVENCPFKYYLKRHQPTDFIRDRSLKERQTTTSPVPSPVGWAAPFPFEIVVSTVAEVAQDVDEEFAEFFSRLPDR